MASHERGGERTVEQGRGRRIAIATGLASVAVFATILAYSVSANRYDNTPKLPERNAPAGSAYSLNIDSTYYDRIEALEQNTDNQDLRNKLEALSTQPIAEWLLDDTAATYRTLDDALAKSKAEQTLPVFVAYDIPNRDLGSHSAGGAGSAEEYQQWIDTLSEHIGENPSIIILEPDAVPQLLDMDARQAEERKELLAYSLDAFQANPNTAVYLDMGNSAWLTLKEATTLLEDIDNRTEQGVSGISLNVSNFRSEEETKTYAAEIQKAFGKSIYVMIDTSRNGAPEAVPDGDWCNPEGQRLGSADQYYNPTAAIETAYIKAPGESDGDCGISDKRAGEFDGDLLFHQLGH